MTVEIGSYTRRGSALHVIARHTKRHQYSIKVTQRERPDAKLPELSYEPFGPAYVMAFKCDSLPFERTVLGAG